MKIEEQEVETWKPVVGYEGLYEVSNMGNVKSCSKEGNGYMPRILKAGTMKVGYKHVALHKSGKQTTLTIHRLVAIAFLPNPENKKEVNHKNGARIDNRLENL